MLFIRGKEAGTQRLRINRILDIGDVIVENCDEILFNEEAISLESLCSSLSDITNDTHKIRLVKAGVSSEFILEFRVASEADLDGVEKEFFRLASGRRLNARVVSDFIDAASHYITALPYCDGVSGYLFGALLKEGASGSQLSAEKYVDKFSSAAVTLSDYDRQLARAIAGIIAFHFNQFSEAVSIAPNTRVSMAASRFTGLLKRKNQPFARNENQADRWEKMITDLQTERILRWAAQPVSELVTRIDEMESMLDGDPPELDRPKLHILLGVAYACSANNGEARHHAAALRNIPAFEGWAEALIRDRS